MTDILIRNVSPDDVAALDMRAESLGLSRADYLRRVIRQANSVSVLPVTTADMSRMAAAIADLGDPVIMRDAWS